MSSDISQNDLEIIREPLTGYAYKDKPLYFIWTVTHLQDGSYLNIYWDSPIGYGILIPDFKVSGDVTSYAFDGYIYHRGNLRSKYSFPCKSGYITCIEYYDLYRTKII